MMIKERFKKALAGIIWDANAMTNIRQGMRRKARTELDRYAEKIRVTCGNTPEMIQREPIVPLIVDMPRALMIEVIFLMIVDEYREKKEEKKN